MELNAYRSTTFRDHKQLVKDLERIGGLAQCLATRENILYCVDVLRENSESALDILAETVLHPAFPEDELVESRQIVALQQEELPSEVFSRDLVQRAGYMNQPLGNPHFCSLDAVDRVDKKVLESFRAKHFYGENCVIAGTGIDHDVLVKWVEKKFGAMPSTGVLGKDAPRRLSSSYTGGMLKNERQLKEEFVKVAMGFEIGGWHSSMLVPVCVMQQLLGGGSSFSAGGPGKGMFTRLYTQVLNRYHWAESVESFLSIHDEHGLLGIDGACPKENVSDLIRVIVDQFTTLSQVEVSDEELNRSKNMLKSTMMMQLESRLVTCEDIARQYITFNNREDPASICAKIDAVTKKDLQKVAALMLERPPAIGCVGHDLSHVPKYEDIAKFVQQFRQNFWHRTGVTSAAAGAAAARASSN